MNLETLVLVLPALNQNFGSVVQKSLPPEILDRLKFWHISEINMIGLTYRKVSMGLTRHVAARKNGSDARNRVERFKILD